MKMFSFLVVLLCVSIMNLVADGLPQKTVKYPSSSNQDSKSADLLDDLTAQLYFLTGQELQAEGQADDIMDENVFHAAEHRGKRMGPKSSELRNQLISKVAENMGMSPMVLLDKLKPGGKKDVLAMKDAFVGSRG